MTAANRRELFAPGRLWSLWDMLILDARRFANLVFALTYLQMDLQKYNGSVPLPPEGKEAFKKAGQDMAADCESLELLTSAEMFRHAFAKCDDCNSVFKALDLGRNTLFIELNKRKFYAPEGNLSKYYDKPKLFGDEVFSKFPSANEDIYEAGMCLALDRATACVMHLNRALEVALAALATTVGVARQNDWGKYLKGIEDELDRRAKSAGARSADEQFYAESGANFDRLRRAFRNPTMHPEKTYSSARAEEILVATKSFMMHLAARISE